MIFSRVKLSCFRANALLVFHWCLYNEVTYPQDTVVWPLNNRGQRNRKLVPSFKPLIASEKNTSLLVCPQAPKFSVGESQQKYKDLYGNPDKRPEKIILRKNCQLKS